MKFFDRWSIAILIVIAAWMIWAAGHYTVFDDEAFSCQRYVLPMGEMVRALWDGVEPDPPLYYVLQNLSVRVVGVGPLGLRALSIVMFLAGLVAMRAAGRAWFGERVGDVTMLLCAVHPAHLFFGFAARWYSTMFLMVALLLWVSKRLADVVPVTPELQRLERRLILLWALIAAGVCYTNYFGPVVVALVWSASLELHHPLKRWFSAGVLAVVLYAPWLPPFWRQATAFPQFSGSPTSTLATAARTVMALLAGDLASPRAWWVWGPMAVFAVLFCLRLWQDWARVRSVAAIVMGCFFLGAVSRTMIDKYVMTFSGVACLLVAALLSLSQRNKHTSIRLAAGTTLALAWSACGFNLVRETHWSSLRWLDPWEKAVSVATESGLQFRQWAVSHPAGRYYAAMEHAKKYPSDLTHRIFVGLALMQVTCIIDDYIRTPPLLLYAIENQNRDWLETIPIRVITIEAADFADAAEWRDLLRVLGEQYEVVDEKRFLEDTDAAWKDRIDPKFKHPRWRITVRTWERADSN